MIPPEIYAYLPKCPCPLQKIRPLSRDFLYNTTLYIQLNIAQPLSTIFFFRKKRNNAAFFSYSAIISIHFVGGMEIWILMAGVGRVCHVESRCHEWPGDPVCASHTGCRHNRERRSEQNGPLLVINGALLALTNGLIKWATVFFQ